MNKNVAYQTDQLVRYFTQNRIKWEQFYDSERAVVNNLKLDFSHSILDIGCGCGGLGLALRDEFGVRNYTGVEINSLAAEAGRTLNPDAQIYCGDILDLTQVELRGQCFDAVFSLSCVDWNVQFSDMLAVAWGHVKPGGCLVATFRLTTENGCDDKNKSFQYINYDGVCEGECASYVVLNANTLFNELDVFSPSRVHAFGYWGAPSVTAVTPYEKLCFCAFSIHKRTAENVGTTCMNLELPEDVIGSIGHT